MLNLYKNRHVRSQDTLLYFRLYIYTELTLNTEELKLKLTGLLKFAMESAPLPAHRAPLPARECTITGSSCANTCS